MIAYASLAGLPPQAGLYTLLASLALYAIFGTSRQLVVAGTSASAILVFSAVTDLAPKSPVELPRSRTGATPGPATSSRNQQALEDPRRDRPPTRGTLAVRGRAQPDGRPGRGWSGGLDGPEVFHDD